MNRDLSLDLQRVARAHGWATRVESSWGWWDRSFTRDNQVIYIRIRGNKLTGLTINDGSGVIYVPKANKRVELMIALGAPLAAHRDVTVAGSSLRFCACGQGFSGHAAAARLTDHIVNPDPMSTAALMIRAMA